jgi:short subunit dehydrogenase-like uncharacterized protein
MRFGFVRGLVERRIARLPEGPSDAERARAKFGVVAEARGKKGVSAAWVAGGDGYDFTAESAALCATRAAEPGFSARGALTPSQAFGARALLEGLAGNGVTFGIRP